jgi:hypothetical protein
LGETASLPEGEQALANGRFNGPRRVADQVNDGRPEMESRLRSIELPVGDGTGVDVEPLCDFPLEQAEVEPPAQVVADGAKCAFTPTRT